MDAMWMNRGLPIQVHFNLRWERLSATYTRLQRSTASIIALSKVSPWLLWIVIAHASRTGMMVKSAQLFSSSVASIFLFFDNDTGYFSMFCFFQVWVIFAEMLFEFLFINRIYYANLTIIISPELRNDERWTVTGHRLWPVLPRIRSFIKVATYFRFDYDIICPGNFFLIQSYW